MFLAHHVHPENSNSLYKAYLDAPQLAHGYLILDLTQDTDKRLRYRTNIFTTEHTIVYSPIDHETNEIELSCTSRN